MRAALTLIGIINLLLAGPAVAEPLSFRGLSASSKSSEVRKIFPNAQRKNICRAGVDFFKTSDGEMLCEELFVDNYALNGLTFKASFLFNPDGTLRHVSLLKQFGAYGKNGQGVPATAINSAFISLADLISSKYGQEVADPPGAFMRLGPVGGKREWQPGRGTKWQHGGDRIALSADAIEKSAAPGLYVGSVQIFYSFAKKGEFDRF